MIPNVNCADNTSVLFFSQFLDYRLKSSYQQGVKQAVTNADNSYINSESSSRDSV